MGQGPGGPEALRLGPAPGQAECGLESVRFQPAAASFCSLARVSQEEGAGSAGHLLYIHLRAASDQLRTNLKMTNSIVKSNQKVCPI